MNDVNVSMEKHGADDRGKRGINIKWTKKYQLRKTRWENCFEKQTICALSVRNVGKYGKGVVEISKLTRQLATIPTHRAKDYISLRV